MIRMARVSPNPIFFRPPGKLVIEIEATGRYQRITWQKNTVILGNSGFPFVSTEFSNHFEIFVKESSTESDLGLYEIFLFPAVPQRAEPRELDYSVLIPSKL